MLTTSTTCASARNHGNRITEDVERAKLALVVETAAEVWGGA